MLNKGPIKEKTTKKKKKETTLILVLGRRMGRRVIFIQHFLFPIFFPIFLGKERGGGVEKSWAQGENNLAHHFLSPKIIPTKHPSHLKYLLFSLPHFSSSLFSLYSNGP